MKFVITRASRNPIGESYKLLHRWQDDSYYHKPVDYGIIEINSLEELPDEEFILNWGVYAYAYVPETVSIEDIDGIITLYDDYIE